MSAYCIYNIKEHTMTFEEFDSLAKELVQYGVRKNIGFFFHSFYVSDLIKSEKMQNYFLISDSFLYQNADELLSVGATAGLVEFKKKYSFFEDIIKILRKYKIQKLVLYISDETEEISDFETFETSDNNLIETLFENIEKNKEKFAGRFYPLKIVFKLD